MNKEDQFLYNKQKVSGHLVDHAVNIYRELGIACFNLMDFYFGGGCIYSLWNDQEPKDFDIFCTNKQALKKLKEHFALHPEQTGFKTENAYTVGKYQFVLKHVGNLYKEVAKYDFKHNMFFYDSTGLQTVSDWKYLDSNELIFNDCRARDVLNIVNRIPKFIARGMTISKSETLRILEKGTKPTKVMRERKSIKRQLYRKQEQY